MILQTRSRETKHLLGLLEQKWSVWTYWRDAAVSVSLSSRTRLCDRAWHPSLGQHRIYETGVSYDGRDYTQGKKITWVDSNHRPHAYQACALTA